MIFLHSGAARFLACTVLLSSSWLLGTAWASPHGKRASTNFPGLLEATTEDLAEGLKKGLFTSVDLVNVSQPLLVTTCSATRPDQWLTTFFSFI